MMIYIDTGIQIMEQFSANDKYIFTTMLKFRYWSNSTHLFYKMNFEYFTHFLKTQNKLVWYIQIQFDLKMSHRVIPCQISQYWGCECISKHHHKTVKPTSGRPCVTTSQDRCIWLCQWTTAVSSISTVSGVRKISGQAVLKPLREAGICERWPVCGAILTSESDA